MKIKHEPDLKVGNNLIEMKVGMSSIRNLRASLLQLAFNIVETPLDEKRSLLLVEPKITKATLSKEWDSIKKTLQANVFDRMSLIVFKKGEFFYFPNIPNPAFYSKLEQLISFEKKQVEKHRRIYRGSSFFVTIKILIHQWLLNKGPMTVKWLAENAGYSYPIIANILQDLGSLIERQSDRRIGLSQFPNEAFARLLTSSEFDRYTTYYTDYSNQPFSAEFYLRRLEKMNVPSLAIGGILGAKHYSPGLDLVGTPRLDISLHNPNNQFNVDFIEKLDPALKPVSGFNIPANIAIHFIRHKVNFFEPREGGLFWADPIECLLDLHELHLEAQAMDFLNVLQSRRLAKS